MQATFQRFFVFILSFFLSINLLSQVEKADSSIAEDSIHQEDVAAIEKLIRNVYEWHEKNPLYIMLLKDQTDSIVLSLDTLDIQVNSEELEETQFFAARFISNYSAIYHEIIRKLRSGEIIWKVDQLPPFGSGANEWCNCQDVPFDKPSPWSLIEVEKINLTENSGEFNWKWGNIDPHMGSGWNSFRYHFNVEKINGKWKISYLEGFEFDEFTRVW